MYRFIHFPYEWKLTYDREDYDLYFNTYLKGK